MYWNENLKLQLRTTVLLKGGGVRGVYFPGMLDGLSQHGVTKFFGLAGASAGALVAVGIWAGFSPRRLSQYLEENSGKFGLVPKMFFKKEIIIIVASGFYWKCIPFKGTFIKLFGMFRNIPRRLRNLPPRESDLLPGAKGLKFEQFINQMIIKGLEERGIHKELLEYFFDTDINELKPTFEDIFFLSKWLQYISDVESITDPDFDIVAESFPDQLDYIKENASTIFTPRNGAKNEILTRLFGENTAVDPYFPPLFMSAFNVTRGEPIIFNNLDPRFSKVPIAKMARASAGHPAAYRPVRIKLGKDEKFLASDGGLVFNFPASALEDDLRRLLHSIASGENLQIFEDYWPMVFSPYIILGLSTKDKEKKLSYYNRLMQTYNGGAREILEKTIADKIPYFRGFEFPNENDIHYLNFFGMKKTYISNCFSRANSAIRSTNIKINEPIDFDDNQKEFIKELLNISIKKTSNIFRIDTSGYLRSHLYLETGDLNGFLGKKAMTSIGKEASLFDDCDNSFEREHAGVIGLTRNAMKPTLGRLDLIQKKRKNNPSQKILNLNWNDVRKIPRELNFVLTVPIFDFYHIQYEDGPTRVEKVKDFEDSLRTFDTGALGPAFGVLSIDGVSKDAEENIDNLAILVKNAGLIEMLERAALDIGKMISKNLNVSCKKEREFATFDS